MLECARLCLFLGCNSIFCCTLCWVSFMRCVRSVVFLVFVFYFVKLISRICVVLYFLYLCWIISRCIFRIYVVSCIDIFPYLRCIIWNYISRIFQCYGERYFRKYFRTLGLDSLFLKEDFGNWQQSSLLLQGQVSC